MKEPKVKRPKAGDPIFLLYRHGKMVDAGNAYPRIFYSEEHFEMARKMRPRNYLSTDVLVKYVPAAEDPKMEEN